MSEPWRFFYILFFPYKKYMPFPPLFFYSKRKTLCPKKKMGSFSPYIKNTWGGREKCFFIRVWGLKGSGVFLKEKNTPFPPNPYIKKHVWHFYNLWTTRFFIQGKKHGVGQHVGRGEETIFCFSSHMLTPEVIEVP